MSTRKNPIIAKCIWSFSIFVATLFLQPSQVTCVTNTFMISTSTPQPNSLTTTKPPFNTDITNQLTTDFISLLASLDGLKFGQKLLTGSDNETILGYLEKGLTEYQDIVSTLETKYGYLLKQAYIKESSFHYKKQKDFLIEEFHTLFTECKEVLDNVDVQNFDRMGAVDVAIIKGCLMRAETLPAEMFALIDLTFPLSYFSAMDSLRRLINEMITSNLFEKIDKNSRLILKELDYMMKMYEDNLLKAPPKQNRAEVLIRKRMEHLKIKLNKIREVLEKNVTQIAINNFLNATKNIFTTYDVPEYNLTVLATELKNVIVKEHLQNPPLLDNSSIESWAASPGVYKIKHFNNVLRSLFVEMTPFVPNLSAKEDLSTWSLFTENSTTLMKNCVNSPKHLVGTCTAENHELCQSALVYSEADDDEEESIPQDEDSFESKHCICGFVKNCDATSKLGYCFLIPNSDGQCRGGVGYPCKTHPLQPGYYDESCISGNCNRERNSCEVEELSESKEKSFETMAKRKLEHTGAMLKHIYNNVVKTIA